MTEPTPGIHVFREVTNICDNTLSWLEQQAKDVHVHDFKIQSANKLVATILQADELKAYYERVDMPLTSRDSNDTADYLYEELPPSSDEPVYASTFPYKIVGRGSPTLPNRTALTIGCDNEPIAQDRRAAVQLIMRFTGYGPFSQETTSENPASHIILAHFKHGHTKANARALGKLLETQPNLLPSKLELGPIVIDSF